MKNIRTLLITPLLTLPINAATIVYNLRDTGQTAAIEAGAYTVDSVLLTMSSPQGSLNQTGTSNATASFGVDHAMVGDDTDTIDGLKGSEVFNFSFDVAGVLDQVFMSKYLPDETFDLKKNGVFLMQFTNQGAVDEFNLSESFVSSDVFSITHTAGNGASLSSITITTVPEPSSSLLVACAVMLGLVRRRR